MNCPVCNRKHAVTLSICPSCGAMMNDSVREELEVKKAPVLKPNATEKKEFFNVPNKIESPILKPRVNAPIIASVPNPILEKTVTSENLTKPTAPTLVEFQSKNAAFPEWRLQLQNAVRKRLDSDAIQTSGGAIARTEGATALKIQPQYVAETVADVAPEFAVHANPTLNNALRRIAQSRQQFLVSEEIAIAPIVAETPAPTKVYPYRIAAKSGEIIPDARTATANYTVKPRTAVTLKTETKEFDTNKLPPLNAEVSKAFDIHKTLSDDEAEEIQKTELKLVETEEIAEEIEDIAPFSMRFNAGLFDLIIGSFATLILLAPFMLRGEWFSFGGFLGFLAVCAVVMFVYMTVAVGFYGRTVGMRLFALEVVDIEGENYPTIHQAAVSSSLYLLSMAFGGVGFLTLPFNEDKRAVHDLASGTIVVKEI